MNTITILASNLSANVITDHQLIQLTVKQSKQIQIIREAASVGDLLDVATSRDKTLSTMVLSQLAACKMHELISTYLETKNPSGLVRWVNLQIGTQAIPAMPAKRIELTNYEATIAFWVKYNAKGDENTEKTSAARARAVSWMLPVFDAITQVNTVAESLQG